jgi:hypothetical protein
MSVLKPDPNDPDEVVSDDNDAIRANSSDPAYEKDSFSSKETDDKQADSNESDEILDIFRKGFKKAGDEPGHEADADLDKAGDMYKTDEELDTAA